MLKFAKVVPIFKGCDHTKLINYRPVSVLPAISKIFEKLMYERILSFACKYSLYPFFVKRLIYFAFTYPFICYCLSTWEGAANLHAYKILVLLL